jgi:hypothetical protein
MNILSAYLKDRNGSGDIVSPADKGITDPMLTGLG